MYIIVHRTEEFTFGVAAFEVGFDTTCMRANVYEKAY